MQVGISTASLFPRLMSDEALLKIQSLGVGVAELFFSTFSEYDPSFIQPLTDKISLTVNSVHSNSNNFEPNFFNPTQRVRDDATFWLNKICQSAQLVGCKNYTFHGFNRLSGNSIDNFPVLAQRLSAVIDQAQNYGVTVNLENVHWCTYNRPGVFAELKKYIPQLKGVFDIKQARRSGYPWQMYVKEMGTALNYAHVSDIRADGKMCLPGLGLYDYSEILKTLHGEGFNGNIIIEAYFSDYEKVEELLASHNYLQEIIYKNNLQ